MTREHGHQILALLAPVLRVYFENHKKYGVYIILLGLEWTEYFGINLIRTNEAMNNLIIFYILSTSWRTIFKEPR